MIAFEFHNLTCSSHSFESLVVLLREKPIINVTKAALQRIHLLSTFRHGSPSKALTPENVNVRVFLAGFMIAYRPTHVFEAMGPLEKALYEAAIPLLKTFQNICSVVKTHGSFQAVPSELTENFPTMLFEYLKRFKAWKIPDEAKLTCRIKHALIALYQAEEHLPFDEPEDSKLKIEFRTQIERLRSKLLQIAGHAAVAEFDTQRKTGPNVPLGGTCSGAGGVYAALPGRMTNEQLAHELLMDPAFQLDESGGCGVENPVFQRIRESFHQAFWDSLVDDLRLPTPCYVRVLRVLGEIRDGISDLAGCGECSAIAAAIDLAFIRQQAETGAYGWPSCIKLVGEIVSLVLRVQSPKRDEETKAKWAEHRQELMAANADTQPRAFCKALEFLLDRVNMMRIDAANARLRLISPVIKDHGVDYERGKFQDKLKDGTLTLDRTTRWIDAALDSVLATKLAELSELLEGKPQAFIGLHSRAMLALIAKTDPIKHEVCPETLLFDVHRLCQLQAEYQLVVKRGAMLVTATHLVTATKHADVPEALKELQDIALGAETAEAAADSMIGAITVRGWVPGFDAMRRQIEQCKNEQDAVVQLM